MKEQIMILKSELSIRVGRASLKDRKRITIGVIERLLAHTNLSTAQAFFLEVQLFKSLQGVNLTCDVLPEEMCLKNLKIWDVNPLRLVSEGYEPDANSPWEPTARKIIEVLEGDKENGRRQPGENLHGNRFTKISRYQKRGIGKVKSKRDALHKPKQDSQAL